MHCCTGRSLPHEQFEGLLPSFPAAKEQTVEAFQIPNGPQIWVGGGEGWDFKFIYIKIILKKEFLEDMKLDDFEPKKFARMPRSMGSWTRKLKRHSLRVMPSFQTNSISNEY